MNATLVFRAPNGRAAASAGIAALLSGSHCLLRLLAIAWMAGCGWTPTVVAAEPAHAAAQPLVRNDAEQVKPPLSTIVEIQNHGERFFDQSDAAVVALNRIAESDEIWEAARAAKARADANPDDPQAQQGYRAARARFYWERIQRLVDALQLQDLVMQSHGAICNQLEVEITAVEQQATAEKTVVQRQEDKHRQYVRQLQQVKNSIAGVEELDPEALELMKHIQREVTSTEHHRVLAKERELLATESLNDLRETKIQADRRFAELQDEFTQARRDLSLLREIARNDQMLVTRAERKAILDRQKQYRPITVTENRQVVSEALGRIRDRQIAWAAGQSTPEDHAVSEARLRVQQFLNNLPDADPDDQQPAPSEDDSIRD